MKIFSNNPIDSVFIFSEKSIFNTEDIIRIRTFYGFENGYEINLSPEEALQMANILTKIANELIDNNNREQEKKIEPFKRYNNLCPSAD